MRPFTLIFLFFLCHFACSSSDTHQTYIIHVQTPPNHFESHQKWHESFFPKSNVGSNKSGLLYSYKHTISGFAARLTKDELNSMSQMDGFLHARPDRIFNLTTTHTPRFLNLDVRPNGFWNAKVGYGKGVIIGVIDTGIFPTHPSFDDKDMPSPPAKWRGRCDFNASLCNNKLIGARTFDHNVQSNGNGMPPFDNDGHGTHVAGTAAGNFVENASLLGNANGTAAGIAPHAHIAVYKVCDKGCGAADIVAAVECAVDDGVDVISISLGSGDESILNDTLAIASLGAVKKGVLVSLAAGNEGPDSSSINNAAPWLLTVGASTTDRRISAILKLGSGIEFQGESGYQPANFSSTLLPLVYPEFEKDDGYSKYCTSPSLLKQMDVKGKIVVCVEGNTTSVEKGEVVKESGGAAMILLTAGYVTKVYPFTIPASVVSYDQSSPIIKDYIRSTSSPTATIFFEGTQIGWADAPGVASSSSRGPSLKIPGFIKPDIVGPGVNILAASPTSVGPFEVTPPFSMKSGTSMSCPHLSGIAALLKSAHPDWSPAMIKSAIVTTADTNNLKGEPIMDMWKLTPAGFYEMGAGHVNPIKAYNPGIVYDNVPDDYVAYLCGLGYTDKQVTSINIEPIRCSDVTSIDSASLNYPSLVVNLASSQRRQVLRTVTNVGPSNSFYTVDIIPPYGIQVTIEPRSLSFTNIGEKLDFVVNVSIDRTTMQSNSCEDLSGYYIWVSSEMDVQVRSPLVVKVC